MAFGPQDGDSWKRRLASTVCLAPADLGEHLVEGPINQMHEIVRICKRAVSVVQAKERLPPPMNFPAICIEGLNPAFLHAGDNAMKRLAWLRSPWQYSRISCLSVGIASGGLPWRNVHETGLAGGALLVGP
jgi:hypothetical protein